MKVAIIGAGFVGLTLGAILSSTKHEVFCLDIDNEKINTIKKGKSYFYEPGLDEFIEKGINSGKLVPTLSYKQAITDAEVIFLTLGTPSNADGSLNLEFIYKAIDQINPYLNNNAIVAIKSTVPVGTCRQVQTIINNKHKGVKVVSCPEFLAEASAVYDTLNMDRIVIGSDYPEARKKVASIMEDIDKLAAKIGIDSYSEYTALYKKKESFIRKDFSKRLLLMSLESAELVKVSANSFLATKISFANFIAQLAEQMGADINDVLAAIGMDSRIGRSNLYAGLGWGGSCFPKDVSGLIASAKSVGVDAGILEAVTSINNQQIDLVVSKVNELSKQKKISSIAVLGLSFKPGTSDIRYSPPLTLIKKLLDSDYQVRAFDPKAIPEVSSQFVHARLELANSAYDAANGSDLLILATEWPEFLDLDYKRIKTLMKQTQIIDARNRLDKQKLQEIGFSYYGIGR